MALACVLPTYHAGSGSIKAGVRRVHRQKGGGIMITMLSSEAGPVPAIAVPEVLSDTEDVKTLRDALFEMLEIVLSDDDLKYVTPANSLYMVACLIRTLTKDLEAKEKGTAV